MPLEQHGLRDHNCLGVVLTKTLFNDIMRQKFWAADEVPFNAHTYYNRVVHNYGSMSLQAFLVPMCVTICMLMAVYLMEFFLRMTHGDSITTYGGRREK